MQRVARSHGAILGPAPLDASHARRGLQVRYDAVFLDVDGTLLWIDLDVEGYVEAPEATFVVRDLNALPDLLRG